MLLPSACPETATFANLMARLGHDRPDLRLGKIMCDRLHDRRGVGLVLVLTSFFFRVGQLAQDGVRKLTGEPRKGVGALPSGR